MCAQTGGAKALKSAERSAHQTDPWTLGLRRVQDPQPPPVASKEREAQLAANYHRSSLEEPRLAVLPRQLPGLTYGARVGFGPELFFVLSADRAAGNAP